MKTHKVLDIFKDGLQVFVEVTVKLHHETLLGRLPDSTNSGFTRLKSCYECSLQNLKPRHSEYECPSENFCFCKSRRREKRPCPNKICDYIYEGIIENHVKFSPNLKTTNISQWTQNYWEIAMCYMKHRSESAEGTDLIDLLHLVSKNRFILKKFLPKYSTDSEKNNKEVLEENLSKIQREVIKDIKICQRVKRSSGLCSPGDIINFCRLLSKINDETAHKAIVELEKILAGLTDYADKDWRTETEFASRVRNAVSKHFESAENALRCRLKHKEVTPLQLSFEQKLLVCQTPENFKEENFTESNIVDVVYGDQPFEKILVKSEVEHDRSASQWDEKEWFIYNVLGFYFNYRNKQSIEKEFHKSCTVDCKYSDVVVVSKSVSNRTDMPLKTFCEVIRDDILPKSQHSLVILDFCEEIVRRIFQHESDVFKAHTLVILLGDWDSYSYAYKKSQCLAYVKPQSVRGLVIRNIGADLHLRKDQKDGDRIVQQCLYKCIRKIGDKNLSTLTLERICFQDSSTKIKVSNIPQVKTLKLRDCALTPVFGQSLPSLMYIEIYSVEKMLSVYLEQIKLMLYPALHSCICLQHIATSEIRIGHKSFFLKLKRSAFENNAKEYFGVKLSDCYKNITLDLLDTEVAKVLYTAKCNYDDYDIAVKEEKIHILNSVKYGLLESDSNFIRVFPAVCYQKDSQSQGIVFVCFMKENFDVEKEGSSETYRGFDTFQRSYFQVSPESSIAESSVPQNEEKDEHLAEMLTYAAEIITLNSKDLMEKHSNLEVISVSLGKARENMLDITDGPYIVLYVRLKSFVPYGEDLFPTKLYHPYEPSVILKTDVREGYYLPLADTQGGFIHPLVKVPQLAMGCSIGFQNNKTAATLGPFVEIESGTNEERTKDIGFLTVCHLFSLPSHYQAVILERGNVVQPSFGDERCIDVAAGAPARGLYPDTVCGEVVACEYSDEVDAAVVRITKRHPRRSHFITCGRGELTEAGFSRVPEYKDGSIAPVSDCFRKNVVKFGKKTYLTFGQCRFQGMAVRIIDDRFIVTCPVSRDEREVKMKNLLQVAGFGGQTFSDIGDSGAGLFLVKDDNSLSCIGMVIGKTADGFTVATPIQTILDRLSGSLLVSTKLENCKITMKTFLAQ